MLSSPNSSIQYSANGATSDFSFPYLFYSNSHLVVVFNEGGDDDLDIVRILNVDYTVTGAGSDTGGIVKFVTAPANGSIITIYRSVPYTQPFDYIEGDAFPAESHEKALDLVVMMIQQIANNTLMPPASLIRLAAPTGSTSQKTIVAVTGSYYKFTAWLVDGDKTTPTLVKTLSPPDGNPLWTQTQAAIADADGNYSFVFNHAGMYRTWRLCVEVAGLVVMSDEFGLGA